MLVKPAGFSFQAEEPLTSQVKLIDNVTRSCFCEWRGLLLLPSSGSSEAVLFKDPAGARLFACSMIGVFFMCKRQQLGDPNEAGAQQEVVWIKSSCLSQRQMLLLQAAGMIAVWMVLRCDKCYLAGNLSSLTPSKDRIKLVNIEIAYRYVRLLAIQNPCEFFLLHSEEWESVQSVWIWNAQLGLIAFDCNGCVAEMGVLGICLNVYLWERFILVY